MTTTTLDPAARLNVALFSAFDGMPSKPKFRFEKRTFDGQTEPSDVLVVEDLPVFRSGTFRDSMGYQHTWESIHMDQMVSHFDLLRSRNIFADVPTRKGHPGFLTNAIDEVIGYHTGLRSETRTNPASGEDELYLLATFEVMDPDAITKISSGLWRNVSAEVGSYLSNNETEFWPVYQGVAYVDIPAVEGLKSFNNHQGVGRTFSLMLDNDKEAPVSGDATNPSTVPAPTLPGQTATPPAAPTQAPVDPAYHGRAQFTFSIGGRQTNDFAAVQAHITALEGAQAEAKVANRKAFIKGLAEGATPKILASQIPSIEGYALKLDDEGWAAFEQAHATMPSLSSVSTQAGATQGGQEVNPQGQTPVGGAPQGDAQDDVNVGILEMHSKSGMKADKIKATASYAKVKAANPNHPLILAIG